MKTRIAIICIVALSLVIFIPQASACSCAADRTVEDSFSEEDNVIFSGKVIGIKEQQRTFLVTFKIDQSWKGIPDDVTEINTMTSQSSSSCGYNFEENKSYLVEAFGGWDQTPQVSMCDATTDLGSAQKQVSFLNKQLLENIDESLAFLDSVIIPSPDFDIETAFEVTTPDDCHGEFRYGGHWEWIDDECIQVDPPPDSKSIARKYIFAAPLKQIKAGVAMIDIQCNDGKNVVYKRDRMRAACVTAETENKLIFERGWATMRLGMPATDDHGPSLCDWYGGEWDSLPRLCHGLKYPLLCSMSGGDVIDETCFIPSTTGVAPVEPIRQNDFNCFTYWDATISDVDNTTLEVLLRNEIAKIGSKYDFKSRDITIEEMGENKVKIGIQGCWGWPESFEPDLESNIRELESVKEIK